MKGIPSFIRILFLGLFLFLLINGKIMLWLAIFAVSLIAALAFGRVYCGYVCPMNTLMIPIERISQKLKMQTDETPTWLKGGHFPWITLAISIALMLFSKRFLRIDLPILSFWIVISVLVTLRYKPYVFHNLICPFGALQKTLGRFSLLSHRVEKDACIGCKLCENACSASAIAVSSEDRKAEIRTALCHQCSNCIRVCPKAAIHYRRE